MKRMMGIDYGDARTGIAISDLLCSIAGSTTVIHSRRDEKTIAEIQKLIAAYDVGELVVGLPKNMDGTEGERAQKTREFVDVLKTKTNVEFVFQDERLSSVSAEELLLEGGMKRKDRKQNIDKVAAAIILESYLNSKK